MADCPGVFLPLRDDNPRTRFPAATLLLIAANAVAFLFQLSLTARGQKLLALEAGTIPYEIVNHVDIIPRNLLPLRTGPLETDAVPASG